VTNVLDLFRLDGKVAVVTGASSGLAPASPVPSPSNGPAGTESA
jgi:hypothetical protein